MARLTTQKIDEITGGSLSAFRRHRLFETSKLIIQIFLMGAFALALSGFVVLTLLAGVTDNWLPRTEGVLSLEKLFIEVAANAKAVALFALGFFFREYLTAKGLNGSR